MAAVISAVLPAGAAAAQAPALQAAGVHVALGARPVLRGVDAAFDRGWTAVVGPNGAGKSTLLRVLAGLLRPDAGDVLRHGRSLATLTPRERGRAIAWLPQRGEDAGDGALTVRETAALGRLPHQGLFGAETPADAAALARALRHTDSDRDAGRRLHALSGGERQRALLARALATEAEVLLLDEPTAHLDAPHQVALARLARALGRDRTVLTVLHDLTLALHADRVLLLRDGRVRAHADAEDPALHAALVQAFDGALRVLPGTPRPLVVPRID